MTSIGNVMYTNYNMWLLMTSMILLLAMVGAIVITIKQPSSGTNKSESTLSSVKIPGGGLNRIKIPLGVRKFHSTRPLFIPVDITSVMALSELMIYFERYIISGTLELTAAIDSVSLQKVQVDFMEMFNQVPSRDYVRSIQPNIEQFHSHCEKGVEQLEKASGVMDEIKIRFPNSSFANSRVPSELITKAGLLAEEAFKYM